MDKDSYKLFIAIGACHQLMKDHAKKTKARTDVCGVTHWLDMYNVQSAFRFEEYVDAEMSNGRAICWHLELTILPESFAIEADVSQVYQGLWDRLEEISNGENLIVADCAEELLDATRRLCSAHSLI